jgi:hypothetical protein
MTRSSEIHRVNGLVVGNGRLATASPPWPLLVMDTQNWLRILPALHDLNQAEGARTGDVELEQQERMRGAIALKCLEEGVLPSKDEHPILALRLLLSPKVVTSGSLERYAFQIAQLYGGPCAEPFFVLDARDSVLHLVAELEFLGDLVGPGMLATTAPAAWLSEYSIHLLERHATEIVR